MLTWIEKRSTLHSRAPLNKRDALKRQTYLGGEANGTSGLDVLLARLLEKLSASCKMIGNGEKGERYTVSHVWKT